jgi:predicted transposase/invertase (TIGR01784 family)
MFAAVMLEPENCRQLLEKILEMPIARVEVDREKCMVYHPEYKGIRLDVYARDSNRTHYNIEMQVQTQSLEKRSRYYHSQMDMDLLLSGSEYEKLPDTYVIFICDFDPFDAGKYRYTLEMRLEEAKSVVYDDGRHTVFLSTKGTNGDEVPESLVKFLKYVKAGLEDSTEDFDDEYVKQLQDSVARIKSSREMGERYMVLEEMLRKERAEGKVEGRAEATIENILDILCEKGEVSAELRDRIARITDLKELKSLLHHAVKASSVAEFETYLREK